MGLGGVVFCWQEAGLMWRMGEQRVSQGWRRTSCQLLCGKACLNALRCDRSVMHVSGKAVVHQKHG